MQNYATNSSTTYEGKMRKYRRARAPDNIVNVMDRYRKDKETYVPRPSTDKPDINLQTRIFNQVTSNPS